MANPNQQLSVEDVKGALEGMDIQSVREIARYAQFCLVNPGRRGRGRGGPGGRGRAGNRPVQGPHATAYAAWARDNRQTRLNSLAPRDEGVQLYVAFRREVEPEGTTYPQLNKLQLIRLGLVEPANAREVADARARYPVPAGEQDPLEEYQEDPPHQAPDPLEEEEPPAHYFGDLRGGRRGRGRGRGAGGRGYGPPYYPGGYYGDAHQGGAVGNLNANQQAGPMGLAGGGLGGANAAPPAPAGGGEGGNGAGGGDAVQA